MSENLRQILKLFPRLKVTPTIFQALLRKFVSWKKAPSFVRSACRVNCGNEDNTLHAHLQGLAEEDDKGRNREVDVGGGQPPRTGLEFRAGHSFESLRCRVQSTCRPCAKCPVHGYPFPYCKHNRSEPIKTDILTESLYRPYKTIPTHPLMRLLLRFAPAGLGAATVMLSRMPVASQQKALPG